LSLSPEEVGYLDDLAVKIARKLTDSEIFASQANSEHCRHKIFNGKFVLMVLEKNLIQINQENFC
jgi:phosphoribosylformylglycinamidine synthase